MKKILQIFILSIFGINLCAKPPIISEKEILKHPPKVIRTCCAFGFEMGIAGIPFVKYTDVISVNELQKHHFLGSKNEGNGIIYTQKGGFIDIGHLRDYADWTAYVYTLIKHMQYHNEWDVVKLGFENGFKELQFLNPERINDSNIYEIAGKIAYEVSLWHEIATWFGASYIPLIPEKYSSFSPEDLYSNLLGVHIGIKALKSDMEYNEAVTLYINEYLLLLEAVNTYEETICYMEKVEDIWWTNDKKLPNKNVLLLRYTGNENVLKPFLVNDSLSTTEEFTLSVPDKNLSDLYEFSINLDYKFPLKLIFSNFRKREITQNDFKTIINYIDREIIKHNEKMLNKRHEQNKKK